MFLSRKNKNQSAEPSDASGACVAEPEAFVLSDPGCCRELNEDSAKIVRTDAGLLAIVADGMGGHQAGDVASRTAVNVIAGECTTYQGASGEVLEQTFYLAHRTIREMSKTNQAMHDMGTTCTALIIAGKKAWAAHVGDSRLYLARGGEIYQLSEDHSQCMEMVRKGLLTLEEAKRHEDRNVLIHAMGTRDELAFLFWPEPMEVKPGDAYVLCTDGLHDLVSDFEIRGMVQTLSPESACKELVQKARDRGGYDNITVAVVAIPPLKCNPAKLKDPKKYEVIS